MRMYRSVSIAALAGVTLVASATASAQGASGQPAQVPMELVTALVASPFNGQGAAPRIFIGEVPNGVPAADLPPKPVTVLGGMSAGAYRTVVFVYPSADSDPASTFMKFLVGAGWTRPAVAFQRSGFVEAGALHSRSGTLCRDSARVTVIPLRGAPSGSAWVRADFYPERGMSPCTQRPRMEFLEELVFPVLEAPAGSRTLGTSGTGGSLDWRDISTSLQTSLTPAQLLAHYAAQLQKGGWIVGTALTSDSLGAQRVTTKDTKGHEWTGALVVSASGTESHVALQMARRSGS